MEVLERGVGLCAFRGVFGFDARGEAAGAVFAGAAAAFAVCGAAFGGWCWGLRC